MKEIPICKVSFYRYAYVYGGIPREEFDPRYSLRSERKKAFSVSGPEQRATYYLEAGWCSTQYAGVRSLNSCRWCSFGEKLGFCFKTSVNKRLNILFFLSSWR